jgi:hypothetical protein
MNAMTSPFRFRCLRASFHRLAALVLLGVVAASTGCTDEANPLAPYEGGRPLELLRVTQNFTPEMQWVGGRVAAVGVNRGSEASLDSTLVWLQEAASNDIGSYVTVGENTAASLVRSFGGEPVDSLADGEEYTFWIAERSAFDLALDSALIDPAAFADTTFTMNLFLRGSAGGDFNLDVEYEILREERLLESRFVVTWTPAVPFRQLAIRAAPTGGYTDLVWHILVPDGETGEITPPLVIGQTPPGVQEATAFDGFVEDDVVGIAPTDTTDFDAPVHTLWAVTEEWEEGEFGSSPFNTGYTFFRISGCNFDIDDACE